jgi:pyruvate/2-oxoglutarate dehydrogenase complex dihydrolipoamide dehydrogenase (E3) component
MVLVARGAGSYRAKQHPWAKALGEALRRDDDYVVQLDDDRLLTGDRLLLATGRRPNVDRIGLKTGPQMPQQSEAGRG